MVQFCSELETGSKHNELSIYTGLVEKIIDWYQDAYEKYSPLLTIEDGVRAICENLDDLTETLAFTDSLDYNFGAKLSSFSISDTLVKLILSKYSYGITSTFLAKYGIDFPNLNLQDYKADCWLRFNANEFIMSEILARVLQVEGISYSFDLVGLMTDRSDRNKFTHSLQSAKCYSALRSYNAIRSMLVFLDSDCEQKLQVFEPCFSFNYDEFLAPPCAFDFTSYTTVLVADSVHDLRKDYKEAVANLPWNMVVDLDGYSENGGLMSGINHNQLSKGIMTINNPNATTFLSKDLTYWYRCGCYQFLNYLPAIASSDKYFKNNILNIPSAMPFLDGISNYNLNSVRYKKAVISNVIQKLLQFDRPLNIVMVTNNSNAVKLIIEELYSKNVSDYYLSWIGLSGKTDDDIAQDWFYGYYSDMEDHFKHFNYPLDQFYRAFSLHKKNWKYRISQTQNYTLPGEDGPVEVSENERNNLKPFFDVLYDGTDRRDRETTIVERSAFDKGNIAEWSVISSDYAVKLKRNDEFDQMKTQIKRILGTTNIGARQKTLYFINHKAGMGGTTLCRQLAWSLHKEYAVLVVRQYVQGKISELVSKLYDNTLGKKPIILVADDAVASLKNLCDEVMLLDRRCILLIACRNDNPIIELYPNATRAPLNGLSDDAVDRLREHFHQVSQLSPSLLSQRDRDFSSELPGQYQSPFIIGLYYLEQDFNISRYIEKALDGCKDRRYQDVLARLALCDKYNFKDVPKSLVHSAAQLSIRDHLLRTVPSAESVVCLEQNGVLDCYRFKHPLLSDEYLKQYAKRYYDGSEAQASYDIAKKLIDDVASLPDPKEDHFDLLTVVLIRNKSTTSDDGSNLSALLSTVGTNGSILLLKHLSSTFQQQADLIMHKEPSSRTAIEKTILRTVSHAFAHLGRVYSRDQGNASQAAQNMKQAIDYMPDNDPNIFHMAGSSICDDLRKRWEEDRMRLESEEFPVDFEKYEIRVEEAVEYFEKACDYGSPDYGIPSKLRLLYYYLDFVYKVKAIHSSQDVADNLSINQQKLRQDFLQTLEYAQSYSDLPASAVDRIKEYEDRFRSNLLFGDYRKVIEYYETRLYNAQQKHDIAQETVALRGVVVSRIIDAKKTCPKGTSFYRSIKNADRLRSNIEELLKRPIIDTGYNSRMQRSLLYYHWVQLAKITNLSVENALNMVKQWYAYEEANQTLKDPAPYYYLRLLLYLDALDGNQRSVDEAKKVAQRIHALDLSNSFDLQRSNIGRLKDVLIRGNGLGRLFDVSYCSNDEQSIIEALAKAEKRPEVVSGRLTQIRDHALAEITVFSPIQLSGMPVSIQIGKSASNTLSENQINDHIKFFLGFSYKRPLALADTAADVDKNESFMGLTILSELADAPSKYNPMDSAAPNTEKPISNNKRYSREAEERKIIIKSLTQAKPKIAEAPPQQTQLDKSVTQEYPNLNKLEVQVTITTKSNDLASLSGTFMYEGKLYQVKLPPQKRKQGAPLLKAAAEGKPVPCIIVGPPQAGKYNAKPK